jgi:tetratricopeptide (TPR) repeat protein
MPGEKTEQDAQDLQSEARRLKAVGDYAGALRLRLQLERLHADGGASAVEQAKNLNQLAHVAVHTGAVQEAERAARKCVELYRPIALEHDETLATYMMMLSVVLAIAGKFEEAVRYGEEALETFKLNHGEHDSFVTDRKKDIERMRRREAGLCLDE